MSPTTAFASVKWASDLLDEGLCSEREAVLGVEPESLDQLLHPVFDPVARGKLAPVARGLPAGPGAASGRLVFSAEPVERLATIRERVDQIGSPRTARA